MVIAHHLMWTLYGWWLPNDPRGSTSDTVRCNPLKDLGELHFGRKRLQPAGGNIRALYDQAGERLKYDLLCFSPNEFPGAAEAFDGIIRRCGYTCYALAVMPDHVHVVIRKHKDRAEMMIDRLQDMTRLKLIESGLRDPVTRFGRGVGTRYFLTCRRMCGARSGMLRAIR